MSPTTVALLNALRPFANIAADAALMADVLRGMRPHEAAALREALGTARLLVEQHGSESDSVTRGKTAELIAALRAIADPNKLDASRSPLPDNLARLALSWLAARPEFENARAVLKLYDAPGRAPGAYHERREATRKER